jgi:hypothetical protein
MELPDDVLNLIKEYAQPLTRPDWRKGCYFNRHIYLDIYFTLKEVVDIVYTVKMSQNFNYEYIMLYNELLL